MKRKQLMAMALVGALTLSTAMSGITVHAEEEKDEIGEILDNIFGENPKYEGPTDEKSPYDEGQELAPGSEINWGPIESGSSSDSGNNGGSSTTEEKDEIGEILDNIFGENPKYEGPTDEKSPYDEGQGKDYDNFDFGPSDSGSSSDSGSNNVSNVTGGTTASGSAGNIGAPAATIPGSSQTVAIGESYAVAVTDAAFLAVYPSAMIVVTPEGGAFVHSLDQTGTSYNVWFGGQVADAFSIVDANGRFVSISAPKIVNKDGKTYVDVTIPAKTKGAAVFANEMQESAFTRIFGIDGVMVNGTLLKEFQDTAIN